MTGAALTIDGWLDTAAVARLWGCHVETVKRLAREGAVPARKFHGKWLIAEHVARARCTPDARLVPRQGRRLPASTANSVLRGAGR